MCYTKKVIKSVTLRNVISLLHLCNLSTCSHSQGPFGPVGQKGQVSSIKFVIYILFLVCPLTCLPCFIPQMNLLHPNQISTHSRCPFICAERSKIITFVWVFLAAHLFQTPSLNIKKWCLALSCSQLVRLIAHDSASHSRFNRIN